MRKFKILLENIFCSGTTEMSESLKVAMNIPFFSLFFQNIVIFKKII